MPARRLVRDRAGGPVDALDRHVGPGREIAVPAVPIRVEPGRVERHQHPCAVILESGAEQAVDEVGRLVEPRHRPEVRDPVERREERQRLRQAAVEPVAILGPGDAGDPVPERLAVGRVVEQDAVAESPDLAAEHPV